MKPLKYYFELLRTSKRLGAVSVDRERVLKNEVFARIAEYERSAGFAFVPPTQETAGVRPAYAGYFFRNFISKPIVAGAASLVLMAGGWMTTVSAAANSLPGDTLYNVKLIAERARLQWAARDQRAVLHTEFAERRLQEVSALQEVAKTEPERAAFISDTVNAYQHELASAAEDLRQLQAEDHAQAVPIASDVREQIDTIDLSIVTGDTDEQTQTEEAIAEVQQVATEVAVKTHEIDPSDLSRREIENMFRADLGDVTARRALLLNRLLRLESLTTQHKDYFAQVGVTLPKKSELEDMRTRLRDAEVKISTVTSWFVAGGYRTALEHLATMKAEFRAMEATLAEVEIRLMEALAQKPPEEPAEEPQTEPDESVPENSTSTP